MVCPDIQPRRWLACPTNDGQVEAYWQALASLRQEGLDLDLCPCGSGDIPPWHEFGPSSRWRGMVLFGSDDQAHRLRIRAIREHVAVWVLAV